jgi:hypothetical protein
VIGCEKNSNLVDFSEADSPAGARAPIRNSTEAGLGPWGIWMIRSPSHIADQETGIRGRHKEVQRHGKVDDDRCGRDGWIPPEFLVNRLCDCALVIGCGLHNRGLPTLTPSKASLRIATSYQDKGSRNCFIERNQQKWARESAL